MITSLPEVYLLVNNMLACVCSDGAGELQQLLGLQKRGHVLDEETESGRLCHRVHGPIRLQELHDGQFDVQAQVYGLPA